MMMITIMMMVMVMVMVELITQTGVANLCYKSHDTSYDDGTVNDGVAVMRPPISPRTL